MNENFNTAVEFIQTKCVKGSVPTKRMKSVFSELQTTFPNVVDELSTYSSTDIIWLLTHKKSSFGQCKMCSSLLTREQHIHNRQYCGMKCYKADPDAATLISTVKQTLYNDPVWKRRTEHKKIATNVARSGYEHPMQDPTSFELQQKMSWQAYEYKGIPGLRGYEKYAVDRLLSQGIEVDNIVSGSSYLAEHKIKLQYTSQAGKRRHYMPDIIVKGSNAFIEVKSEFTLEKSEEDNELFYKGRAVNAAGYDLIVWVFDTKGVLIIDALFKSLNKGKG